MKLKKLLSFVAAAAMAVTALTGSLSISASAAVEGTVVDSGQVGENVTYKIYKNGEDAVLVISGTGPMYEEMPEDGWEWDSSSKYGLWDPAVPNITPISRVTEVIVEEGVTTIGKRAFFVGARSIVKITLPSTLVKIGSEAIKDRLNLKEIEGLESATGGLEFEIYAIGNCKALETLTIPDNAILGTRAFRSCTALKTVTLGDNITFNPISEISTKSLGQFENCSALEDVYIYSQELAEEHITAPDSKYPTFDMTNNPTFHVCNESVTEQVLKDKGYITDDNVKYLPVSETFNELQKTIKRAETLTSSKYTEESWTVLTEAIEAAKEITETSSYSKMISAKTAIINAMNKLELKPLGYIRYGWTSTPFLKGVTDKSMAGATQIRLTFDCASDTSFNSYFTTPIEAKMGETVTNFEMKGTTTSENLGETDCTAVMTLSAPVEAEKEYTLTGYTYGYAGAKDYVFAMKKVEFLDEDGNVLGEVTAKMIMLKDLAETIANAEATDTTNYTAESVEELAKAIESAKALTDEATAAEANIAEEAIKTAISNLKYLPADYTSVNEAIAKILTYLSELSKYTDESVKALSDAVAAVDYDLNITEQETVNGYAQAIEDAIAGLAEKPTKPGPTNPEPSKPTTKTPSATTKVTTATKATRSPAVVAKDKAAAEKVMKQAKIKKLTVKSKAKKITVTWKKVKKAVGYEVQISNKKNFKKVVLTKTTAKKKLTIKNKKIKSGKKYYVRVRAYVTYKDANGTVVKVYSNWNKKLRKVTVK